ncbi:sigma-70 family RNA polymerase sigma factor [Sporosarcina highlanderae]|uniref:Sigma-70 family RNA polymerase sigma factor n=1 Tax=Sporosarcina highlanderae TaxID=3035916 RepID=A0ABT8JV31_9BACL|nr:sigma-70 family RNA polymerase sigma factor [Sporosarcina highlanderae]MDN4608802.1 sigma-70 family RNA polymerase sigma factor [Sporosarcina highlanderae]
MTGQENEQEVAKRAIRGDEEAFLQLISMNKEALYRTAFAYLKNEEDAVDAVQEVTMRAFEKIKTLRMPEYAKTWLIRIMMNHCHDVLQKKKRYVFDESIGELKGVSDDFTYMEVEEALSQLSEKDRQLVHLKYLHDIKIKDIADMTSTPEGTVKTRLYKAVKSLRTFLEGKEEGQLDGRGKKTEEVER